MEKKSKKKFYCKNLNVKNKRQDDLSDTMIGVLMTTDKNKEKTCVKDAFNILNEAVENNYPQIIEKLKQSHLERKIKQEQEKKEKEHNEKLLSNSEESEMKEKSNIPINHEAESYSNITNDKGEKDQITFNSDKKVGSVNNISDMLENELKSLRKNQDKMFFNFETNCKGVIFLRVDRDLKDSININKVVYSIVEKTAKTREQLSKAIARFIPIDLAMKAKFDSFKLKAPEIINKYFNVVPENFGKSWKVDIKIRNNNSMLKNEFFDYIISLIDKTKHPVEYKNPDFTILLEISNDLLCFTVVEKYYHYRLYNLLALCKTDDELRTEKEKLMYMQNTAHERKSKIDTEKVNSINTAEEIDKIIDEKEKENNLSLNEGDEQLAENEDEDNQSDIELI